MIGPNGPSYRVWDMPETKEIIRKMLETNTDTSRYHSKLNVDKRKE